MILSEVLDRINTSLGTPDDLTGKNANTLFTNKRIVEQLKNALDQYASLTKGIQDVYSTQLSTNTRVATAPSDAIRSEAYRFIYVWRNGRKYPLTIKDLNLTKTEFPYGTTSGIPRFATVWNDEISVYPDNSSAPKATTLNGAISDSAATITVVSTSGFPELNGRITIESEKIRYTAKTATTFTGCTREIEGTTAASHSDGVAVTENNLFIYYRKKHFVVTVDGSDVISAVQLAKTMEIPDEHIEPIVDMVAYKLLLKIDAERAQPYKIDAAAFFQQAKRDIEAGYGQIVNGSMIGSAYDWEIDNAGVNL
tara:strand:- start:2791 stop:3720 length:930 start_codon:yes stop_codon:yes gene_type:complete